MSRSATSLAVGCAVRLGKGRSALENEVLSQWRGKECVQAPNNPDILLKEMCRTS